MNSKSTYDYIICGAGCAGLSLAMRLCDERFRQKSILIIDKDDKDVNDRTWCFWEPQDYHSIYASVVSNKWNNIRIRDVKRDLHIPLEDLAYKRIRAIDFYNLAKRKIAKAPNIHWIKETVQDIMEEDDLTIVTVANGEYYGDYCFNAIPDSYERIENDYYLHQHFLGFEIDAGRAVFNPNVATLMDFTLDQKDEVRFVYVLPYSDSEAMVEATVFSDNLLHHEEYTEMIEKYINKKYDLTEFKIKTKEYGVIPMTTAKHNERESNRIINIGSRSGRIKPSSGYAFKRIQNESDIIVESIIGGSEMYSVRDATRFRLYDQILFNVLINNRMLGSDIFTTLFEKNPVKRVLKFLDEKTSLSEEAQLFMTLPTWPFLKSMILELKSRLFNNY